MDTNLNCFSLMSNACKKIKGKFWKTFLATFIVVFPLVAISFIPYYIGIIIAVFFSGYLFYGLIEYYKQVFRGEDAKLKTIIMNGKSFGAATLLGIINFISLIVGFILLIFPAIAYMIYYGLGMYHLTDQTEYKVKKALTDNADRMVGNKTLILSYKVLIYFLNMLVLVSGSFLFFSLYLIFSSNFALAVFLGLVVVLVGIVLLTFITMLYNATSLEFYQTCMPNLEDVYELRKQRNEKIIAKRNAKLAQKQEKPETKKDEQNKK